MNNGKAVVLAYVEAFNRGDLDGVCQLFTKDAVVFGVLGWGTVEQARPVWKDLISNCRWMTLFLKAGTLRFVIQNAGNQFALSEGLDQLVGVMRYPRWNGSRSETTGFIEDGQPETQRPRIGN